MKVHSREESKPSKHEASVGIHASHFTNASSTRMRYVSFHSFSPTTCILSDRKRVKTSLLLCSDLFRYINAIVFTNLHFRPYFYVYLGIEGRSPFSKTSDMGSVFSPPSTERLWSLTCGRKAYLFKKKNFNKNIRNIYRKSPLQSAPPPPTFLFFPFYFIIIIL